jgi:proline racemase
MGFYLWGLFLGARARGPLSSAALVPLSSDRAQTWQPPPSWRRVLTVESHAAGEPLRVVTGGLDPIPGATILEKRRFARERLDGLRRGLVFEPRGHADMYGAIPTEPVTPDGDAGVLFMHNEGWSTMCGHGVIALVTVALEVGLLSERAVVRLDTPAGRVTARPRREGDRVRSVAFENVPSFVVSLDDRVTVPGIGEVRYDLAFGGAFYAFVDAASVGLEMTPDRFRDLIAVGTATKRAVMAAREIRHPREPDLSFLYGTIFTGPAHGVGADSRNVCVFAEGEVDRSPTGTGVSARVAIERARGRLAAGGTFVVESIIGTRFTGRIAREVRWEGYDAVVPEVEGSAWVTGRSEILIAPDDPLAEGFILR